MARFKNLSLFVFTVAGLILMQAIGKSPVVQTQLRPGPSRGDIVLQSDDLPEHMGTWQKKQFQPAPDLETMAEGAIAWTHSWTFQNPQLSAYVAFDQAHFVYWHELTICYQGVGWKLEKRTVVETPQMDGWPCVLADLRADGSRLGTVIFSQFDDQGQPASPPDRIDPDRPANVLDRLHGRLNHQRVVLPERLLQAQVLVSHAAPLEQQQVKQLLELHLSTREAFRAVWSARHRGSDVVQPVAAQE